MSRREASLDRDYFDKLYKTAPDPWHFASSDYEQQKYAETIAALPARQFRTGLEVGCSIGILTTLLAARCDQLLAIDVAEAALAQARQNCTAPHVTFANRRVPEEWPLGRYDLIVLSEVLYYLVADDIMRVAACTRQSLQSEGVVLLVHYLGETDYPVTGQDAAEQFLAACALPVLRQRQTALYRIDVLGCNPAE
jgi:trans-aconitate methyltransferase